MFFQPHHSAIETFHIVWLLTGTLSLSVGRFGNLDVTRKGLISVISIICSVIGFHATKSYQTWLWVVDLSTYFFFLTRNKKWASLFEACWHLRCLKWIVKKKKKFTISTCQTHFPFGWFIGYNCLKDDQEPFIFIVCVAGSLYLHATHVYEACLPVAPKGKDGRNFHNLELCGIDGDCKSNGNT